MGRHVVLRSSLIALGFFSLALLVAPIQAATTSTTTIQGAHGLVVSVDANGAYDVFVSNPAWHFGGTIGHALSNVAVASGLDGVGPYSEISFDFTATVG